MTDVVTDTKKTKVQMIEEIAKAFADNDKTLSGRQFDRLYDLTEEKLLQVKSLIMEQLRIDNG